MKEWAATQRGYSGSSANICIYMCCACRVIAHVHVVLKARYVHSWHGFSLFPLEAKEGREAGNICVAVANSKRAGPAAAAGSVASTERRSQREAWHVHWRSNPSWEGYLSDYNHRDQEE